MTAEARDFLFEVGTEELPAAAARAAAEQAGTLTREALARHQIDVGPDNVSCWVTPRRIAVLVRQMPSKQQPREVAERGPVAVKAFDAEGRPTKAAEGFARAKGVASGDLVVREQGGQQFVFAVHRQEGLAVPEVIPVVCREILSAIAFPKTMRWNGGGLRFSRPVRWLVAKYGGDTIVFEAAGITSTSASRGHRFLGRARVEIARAEDYRNAMAENKVIVDQEERREAILAGLATEAGKMGGRFIDPADRLEEVIYLVENPSVHAGSFGEDHLRLPDRILVTAMQSHQRYFPLVNEDGGSLMAGFLYVMNGDPIAAPDITEGNERVLEGRIGDAEFSFDQDLKTGIEAMAARLENVVFHRLLGSLADKTSRLESLVEVFGGLLALCGPEQDTAMAAARLAKADQVSNMVQEFPDLEGYMGSVYAGLEGYSAGICTAIEEHYLPTSAGGELPGTVAGAVLAVADKIDNIMGAFAVDEMPTGSRDPYGLRRAALGLAEISSRYGFDFDLTELLLAAHMQYIGQKADVKREPGVVDSAFEFVNDRIQHRLVEGGMPVEIVEAARRAGLKSTARLVDLAEALDEFRHQREFEDLHTSYFRSSKIAAKAGEAFAGAEIDTGLFEHDAERELMRVLDDLEPRITELAARRDYRRALELASGIRSQVDRFFDDVLVMAEDEAVRTNRLALVSRVAGILLRLGDPILVAAAPE
ncbi:MAG: glycine--tRNA ligase subunit beta [Thermoleophilia bacterium]|nr:glycine--tRNA ligase subunit beta [Thermoleophilia bacterium]